MKKVRMCIKCRQRKQQNLLLRLQIKNGELVCFTNSGRSFYLCESCIQNKNCTQCINKNTKGNIDSNTLIASLNRIEEIWQKKNH